MGAGGVGSILGTVLGVGSSVYSAKQQSKLQQEQINAQKEATRLQTETANKQLENERLNTQIAASQSELAEQRLGDTEMKRRSSLFQRTNYGNEDFGMNIIG